MRSNKANRKKGSSPDANQTKISSFFKPKSPDVLTESKHVKPITSKDDCSSDFECEIIPPTPLEKRRKTFTFFRSNFSSLATNNRPIDIEIPVTSIPQDGRILEIRHNHVGLFNIFTADVPPQPSIPATPGISNLEEIIPPTPSPPRQVEILLEKDDFIPPTQETPRIRPLESNRPRWNVGLIGNLLNKGLMKTNSAKRYFANDVVGDGGAQDAMVTEVFHSPVAKHSRVGPLHNSPDWPSAASHFEQPEPLSSKEEISSAITESIVQLDIKSDHVADQKSVHVETTIVDGENCVIDVPLNLSSEAASADVNISPVSVDLSRACQNPADSSRSKQLASRFGRYIVEHVNSCVDSRGRCTKELFLKCNDGEPERRCILKGFWGMTRVSDGDIVNVLADFDPETNAAVLDDDDLTNSGLLVLNPDRLVSGTAIVSTLFCKRRALFNEWFRGVDSGNAIMFVGTVVHQLFQDSLKNRLSTERDIRKHLNVLLSKPKHLMEMYKFQATHPVEWFTAEFSIFVPKIVDWIAKHFLGTFEASNTRIISVCDIEENVWSPRLGVKGKIDLTVEVAIHSHRNGTNKQEQLTKVMPLELKTGKPSFSLEHCGQVSLYSMMSEDRRDDPGAGLLLYLRDGQMREIPSDLRNRRGLIQRRNELTLYLAAPLKSAAIDAAAASQIPIRPALGQLPKPLTEKRMCEKCPYLTTCAVRHRIEEANDGIPQSIHPFRELAACATAHLDSADIAYFNDWCSWIFLESFASKSRSPDAKNIWCLTSQETENQGEGLSDMVLSDAPYWDAGENRCIHTFVKSTSNLTLTPLSRLGLTANQCVAVSIESSNLLALATGFVASIADTSIRLLLDKNLYERSAWMHATFRIDAYSSQSMITTCLSNVARLMGVTAELKLLRDIIVNRREASFKPKIGNDCALKGKMILRDLNNEQRRAVLKTLMTNDYLLIKGMPGTGKTATIVALIRLLHEMGQSVLLVSHTHSAVDNVLLKLKANGLDFLRLGSAARIHLDLQDYTEESMMRHVTSLCELDILLKSKSVVATTCLGSNHALFSQGRLYDYCIVDEASQVLQPICIGPLFHCRKFVLVGDHDQLPPVVQSIEAKNLGFDETIFARLYSSQSAMELTIQYRMNSEIIRLANILSYKGALKCATQEVADGVLRLPNKVDSKCILIKSALNCELNNSVLFVNTDSIEAKEIRDSNGQIYNAVEAQIVIRLVAAYLQAGLKACSLGVICPFRRQVAHLISALRDSNSDFHVQSVEINTIDQYQGREKEAILLSCVKSGRSATIIMPDEILSDRRRINVAITRARKKLIIIGSLSTLRLYEPMQTLIETLRPEQTINLSSGDWNQSTL